MSEDKELTDVELMALAALVQRETAEMTTTNMQRAALGQSMAYDDFETDASAGLRRELARRSIL